MSHERDVFLSYSLSNFSSFSYDDPFSNFSLRFYLTDFVDREDVEEWV